MALCFVPHDGFLAATTRPLDAQVTNEWVFYIIARKTGGQGKARTTTAEQRAMRPGVSETRPIADEFRNQREND